YFRRAAFKNALIQVSELVLIVLFFVVALRYALLLWFTYLQHLESTRELTEGSVYPPVSIIVPAFNEQVVVASAIESLMQMDYPDFEVIVVDDGSSDRTFDEAAKLMHKYGPARLKVVWQPNGGKAAALNTGIMHARGELLLCMDADSVLEPQTIRMGVRHF